MRSATAAVFVIVFSLPAAPALPVLPVLPALPALRAVPAQTTAKSAPPKPKLFEPQDLGLLEGPDREDWQKPDLIMDALRIAEGSIVADLGAGGGWFSVRLARRVGPRGRVYAEDIQPQMIDAIKGRVERENLSNVVTVMGTADDPRLPPGVDAALIVGSFTKCSSTKAGKRRDPVVLLQNIARSLKPQGRLGVVDFLPGGGGPGARRGSARRSAVGHSRGSGSGLVFISRDDVPPFEYLLIFGRATSARP
jgi:SAM-dependent methyltransferase